MTHGGLVTPTGFLSTPSARRATRRCAAACGDAVNFYPRPPRGGRRLLSINSRPFEIFLSTPSARRATRGFQRYGTGFPISIHALREEGDMQQSTIHLPPTYFYPRPPRGGRRVPCDSVCQTIEDFYPRPPRGGRRAFLRCTGGLRHISIHALREEGDRCW